MDGHVDVEGNLVQLETVDVVVVTLEKVVQVELHLLDLDTGDLGDDIEDTSTFGGDKELGLSSREWWHFGVEDDTLLLEILVRELEWSNQTTLALLARVLLLETVLQVSVVVRDLVGDVLLVLAQVVESEGETSDFLALLLTNDGAIGDFEGDVVHEGFVVIVLGNDFFFLELAHILQDLIDLVGEILVVGLRGVLDTSFEDIHQVEALDGVLDGDETKDWDDQLLGFGVQALNFRLFFDLDLESVGKSELNFSVVFLASRGWWGAKVDHDLAERIFLIGCETVEMLGNQTVGLVDFIERNEDDWLCLVGELHIFVDLEVILRVIDLGHFLEVAEESGLVLGNELVEWHHVLLLGSTELLKIEDVLEDLGDNDEVLTGGLGKLAFDDVVGVGSHDGKIDETVVDEVDFELQNVVLGGIRESLGGQVTQLLADPTNSVGKVSHGVEDTIEELQQE